MQNEVLNFSPNLFLESPNPVCKPAPIQKFSRRSYLPPMPESLWKIQQGVVRSISWQSDGTVVALGIWGPGDIVGHTISNLDPYFLECLTPVDVEVRKLHDFSPSNRLFIEHIYQLETLLTIRSCKRVEEMVIHLLKFLSSKFGRVGVQGQIIDLRLTHQDIADLLGTTRVTVTRILQKLEEDGMIERSPIRKIILKDLDLWCYQI